MEEIGSILIAIVLGALIGLQREFIQQHKNVRFFAGIRTFIFIALLGALLGYLTSFESVWMFLGFLFTILFSLVTYSYHKKSGVDGTTQVVFVLTYVLGAMTTTGRLQVAVILAVLTAMFLTLKGKLHGIAKKIDRQELVAMLEFALIAFVVLPLLPNRNFSPADIPGVAGVLQSLGVDFGFLASLNVLNPYNIWLMVIFIAGLNLAGYFLIKYFGSKKGHEIMGIVGGLVSSTAVAISMAEESKKRKNLNPIVVATILASAVMFCRVIFEVAILNYRILASLIVPLGLMVVVSIVIVMFLHRKGGSGITPEKEIETSQPFAILPALKFGAFFAVILLLMGIAEALFGDVGIYITSLLSGLADVDTVTLTMSNLSAAGDVSSGTAITAIVLAVMSNTVVKAGIAYAIGSKKFGRMMMLAFGLVLLVGLLVLCLG